MKFDGPAIQRSSSFFFFFFLLRSTLPFDRITGCELHGPIESLLRYNAPRYRVLSCPFPSLFIFHVRLRRSSTSRRYIYSSQHFEAVLASAPRPCYGLNPEACCKSAREVWNHRERTSQKREHGRGTSTEGQIREAALFIPVSPLFSSFPLLRTALPRIAASYVPFRASFSLAVNQTTCTAGMPRISFRGDVITIRLIPIAPLARSSFDFQPSL